MNDTSPEVAVKMKEMFQRKTPAERLAIGCSMFDFSRQLVISSLLRETPGLSDSNLRKELFRVFYGSDFSPEQREKISNYFSSADSET